MYNSKISSRFQELVEGSFVDSDNAEYTVDRDGSMIRIERPRPQVIAARASVTHKVNKSK